MFGGKLMGREHNSYPKISEGRSFGGVLELPRWSSEKSE